MISFWLWIETDKTNLKMGLPYPHPSQPSWQEPQETGLPKSHGCTYFCGKAKIIKNQAYFDALPCIYHAFTMNFLFGMVYYCFTALRLQCCVFVFFPLFVWGMQIQMIQMLRLVQRRVVFVDGFIRNNKTVWWWQKMEENSWRTWRCEKHAFATVQETEDSEGLKMSLFRKAFFQHILATSNSTKCIGKLAHAE